MQILWPFSFRHHSFPVLLLPFPEARLLLRFVMHLVYGHILYFIMLSLNLINIFIFKRFICIKTHSGFKFSEFGQLVHHYNIKEFLSVLYLSFPMVFWKPWTISLSIAFPFTKMPYSWNYGEIRLFSILASCMW